MATNRSQNVAYGLSEPLINVFPTPIIANRAPTTSDKAQLGTVWVYTAGNDAWVLTSIVANSATWVGIGGGSGSFTSLTVNPGNITATAGNINATAGSMSAGTTITAGTGFTATTGGLTATAGNIVATAGNISTTAGSITAHTTLTAATGNITATLGNIIATAGSVAAGSTVSGTGIVATNDSGGFATFTTMTNVVDTAQSTGTLVIKSDSANPGTNTGFLKFYVGVTAVYVPYFVTIAP